MADKIYFVENNQQTGPFSPQQINEFVRAGRVGPETMAWHEGLANWQPLRQACPDLLQAAHEAPAAAPYGQPAYGQPQTAPVQGYAPAGGPGPNYAPGYGQAPAAGPGYGAPAGGPGGYAPPPGAASGYGQAPAQPVQPAAYAGPPATAFEIINCGFYRMAKITVSNDEVVLESGALHYMLGNIEIESKMPSVGGAFKSMLSGENIVRPRYRGTGDIYLEPVFGELNIMELRNEEWVLDRGAFLAADRTVTVDVYTNKAFSGLFGGEGFVQTRVHGTGKVLYHSPGPVERLELDGRSTLTVDGSFAVARTASLDYSVEKATKKLFASMTSGEGLVSRFRGIGVVMIAPVPSEYFVFNEQFAGLRSAVYKLQK